MRCSRQCATAKHIAGLLRRAKSSWQSVFGDQRVEREEEACCQKHVHGQGVSRGGCRSGGERAQAWCCASACHSYLVCAAAVGPQQFSCICSESDIALNVSSRLDRRYGLPGCGAPPPLAQAPLHYVSSMSLMARQMAWVCFVCHVSVVQDNSFEIDRTARSADSY